MRRYSVPAIYDDEGIHLLGEAPADGIYRVIVTFIEPIDEHERDEPSRRRFSDLFGIWEDERSAEEIIKEVRSTRRSKLDPPYPEISRNAMSVR